VCVIGEPSGWERITLGYKGRLLVEVRLRAPMAHSAGPARLPAEQAVALWNAIVAYCDAYNTGREKAFDRLDPSLRHIVTLDEGAYGNAQMSLGFRLPPGISPDLLTDELCALLRAGGSSQPSVHLTFSGAEVAFRAEKNTHVVRAFLTSIRQQGGQARFVLKTGTSDMNVVGPTWGCPICAYGPGDSALDHTPDERISLSEYLRSIEILKLALSTLMRDA
jgi:LysW-gamma-L-lysine carboxypeptidase